MRRYVAFLLALLVLLQASWAAAANYCEHEEVTQQQGVHFGHHAHSHAASDTADKPGAKSLLFAADLEHGHCHLSPIALPAIAALAVAESVDEGPSSDLACRVETFIPEGLDRPNWLRA